MLTTNADQLMYPADVLASCACGWWCSELRDDLRDYFSDTLLPMAHAAQIVPAVECRFGSRKSDFALQALVECRELELK
jgi:hypothetical protein